MKSFYSILDNGCSNTLTQAMQHTINGQMATDHCGKIVFYTAEDRDTLEYQSVMRSKVMEKPPVDGIIYLRLYQFCYSGKFDFEFLTELVESGYEVHFSREKLSITTKKELESLYETLKVFEQMARNGQEPEAINA
ncbi:MAG: hypothetical protein ACJZ9F_09555 [Rhodospirillaceae bacterium]